MSNSSNPALILASTSQIRKQILLQAGLNFSSEAPKLDEEKLKQALAPIAPHKLAARLSELKSLSLCESHPKSLILGADQTLSLNGKLFNKPANLDEARQHLETLRGQTHTLHSSLTISQNGNVIWQYSEDANLTMRQFSNQYLKNYLNYSGNEILSSVGAYKLEHSGIQLFERIEGDYFTILGLPLLPLLAFLRQQKQIMA